MLRVGVQEFTRHRAFCDRKRPRASAVKSTENYESEVYVGYAMLVTVVTVVRAPIHVFLKRAKGPKGMDLLIIPFQTVSACFSGLSRMTYENSVSNSRICIFVREFFVKFMEKLETTLAMDHVGCPIGTMCVK